MCVASICEDTGEVMENADWVAIINIEQKAETGQYYLTFKRVKVRYRSETDLAYFNHPFMTDNRLKLIDDVGFPEPLSELSLASDLVGAEMVTKKGKRRGDGERDIVPLDSVTANSVFNFNLKTLKDQIMPSDELAGEYVSETHVVPA